MNAFFKANNVDFSVTKDEPYQLVNVDRAVSKWRVTCNLLIITPLKESRHPFSAEYKVLLIIRIQELSRATGEG